MTWPGASGTGMPQLNVVRLIERSQQAAADEARYLIPARGRCDKVRIFFVMSSSRSCHSDSWKKYDGSLTHSTGAPIGASFVPSGRVVSSEFVVECFIANGIPAFVMAQVEVSPCAAIRRHSSAQEALCRSSVVRI